MSLLMVEWMGFKVASNPKLHSDPKTPKVTPKQQTQTPKLTPNPTWGGPKLTPNHQI